MISGRVQARASGAAITRQPNSATGIGTWTSDLARTWSSRPVQMAAAARAVQVTAVLLAVRCLVVTGGQRGPRRAWGPSC